MAKTTAAVHRSPERATPAAKKALSMLERMRRSTSPMARKVAKAVEKKSLSLVIRGTNSLNKAVLGLSSRDVRERNAWKARIRKLRVAAQKGDKRAAQTLTNLGRRSAALRAARRFRLDHRAIARRVQ